MRVLLLFLLILVFPVDSKADQSVLKSAKFSPAVAIYKPDPKYPGKASKKGHEGWVLLSYVIEADGSVEKAIVEDSNTSEILEEDAVNLVKQYKYKPATMDGKPVQQNNSKALFSYRFDPPSKAARAKFASYYKRTSNLLKKGKYEKAKERMAVLERMENRNLYEDGYYWVLKSRIYESEQQPQEALRSLRRATISGSDYLPETTYIYSMAKLYSMQVKTAQYRSALYTLRKLKKIPNASKMVNKLKQSEQDIIALINSDRLFYAPGVVSKRGLWSYDLARNKFSIADINGKLEKLTIFCSNRVIESPITGKEAWKIPASFGNCDVHVHGEAGATFKLYEYPLNTSSTPP